LNIDEIKDWFQKTSAKALQLRNGNILQMG
jgi:hypothetical protein